MTTYQIVLTVHLFGLAFGMGGVSTIDSILLVASRRGRVTRDLVEVVQSAAVLVACAMVLLAVSGVAFFAVGADPTPKFWAKMVIVGVACFNGLAAHRLILPLIETAATNGTGRLHLRPWTARLAAGSAAVSAVSWSGALVLGAWHGLKLEMAPILAVYATVLTAAVLVSAMLVAPRVFVFASTDVRGKRPLRNIPKAVAFAVAPAIAFRALAVATRLQHRSDWEESDGVEGFIAAPNSTWSDQLIGTTALDWSDEIGVSTGRHLFDARIENEDQYVRQIFGGWPSRGVDAESETGMR